jgi:hypothetical protein
MMQENRPPIGSPEDLDHSGESATASPAELEQLKDPAKQDEYRAAYLAQLRQRACPGCGETYESF